MKLNTSRIESPPSMLMEVMITFILYYICIKAGEIFTVDSSSNPSGSLSTVVFGFSFASPRKALIKGCHQLTMFAVTRPIRNDVFGGL